MVRLVLCLWYYQLGHFFNSLFSSCSWDMDGLYSDLRSLLVFQVVRRGRILVDMYLVINAGREWR
ncbi:uncharacterized protein BDV14DRAFT_182531 [Aspergillus stella-maris]|uniref:uncharacterized protein n=1 Tax=Aspergillus stella-maris TaxID=1810926 RepID=UPI003CCD9FA7